MAMYIYFSKVKIFRRLINISRYQFSLLNAFENRKLQSDTSFPKLPRNPSRHWPALAKSCPPKTTAANTSRVVKVLASF
jgi:hypothetical protein